MTNVIHYSLALALLILIPLACTMPSAPDAENAAAAEPVATVTHAAMEGAGARVNVPGCNNDDGLTDIIGPYATAPFSEDALIFGLPIVSSNCVIGAGPTEHYTALARLPEDVPPPPRPVVWNFENTGLPCYASTETLNFTNDWQQRIMPNGNVKLVCHFREQK